MTITIKGNICILSREQRKELKKKFVLDPVGAVKNTFHDNIMKFKNITFYDDKNEVAKTYTN